MSPYTEVVELPTSRITPRRISEVSGGDLRLGRKYARKLLLIVTFLYICQSVGYACMHDVSILMLERGCFCHLPTLNGHHL